MTRHFGVLIPPTNTTVEIECRLLPATYQAHVGRLKSSGAGSFSPSRDEDIDYQSQLAGTAKVEMVILAQTSASLYADDYDDVVTKRMSAGAGVPAITSAQAVGRAVRALGARRIAIVSPYSEAVNDTRRPLFQDEARARHGRARRIRRDRRVCDRAARPAERARRVRPDRSAGDRSLRGARRQFPDDAVDRRLGAGVQKPVVTTNQASIWAMLRAFDSADRLPAFGRLLAEVPPDA